MEQSKISFESLPELVSSLASEIEGLKTLVKEALVLKNYLINRLFSQL